MTHTRACDYDVNPNYVTFPGLALQNILGGNFCADDVNRHHFDDVRSRQLCRLYKNVLFPIKFTLVRRLYVPKLSSIPCLKWDLQGVGHIDPPSIINVQKALWW